MPAGAAVQSRNDDFYSGCREGSRKLPQSPATAQILLLCPFGDRAVRSAFRVQVRPLDRLRRARFLPNRPGIGMKSFAIHRKAHLGLAQVRSPVQDW
jgi:hypothetical protein